MHYRYLTIEQRERIAQVIRASVPASGLAQALERLRTPAFGVCLECGRDIGFARLEEDPGALHCEPCSRLPDLPR